MSQALGLDSRNAGAPSFSRRARNLTEEDFRSFGILILPDPNALISQYVGAARTEGVRVFPLPESFVELFRPFSAPVNHYRAKHRGARTAHLSLTFYFRASLRFPAA